MESRTGRYAAIDNGVVVNFIVGHENCEHPYDEIVCIEDFDNGEYPVMVGSSYVNGKFIPSEENLRELQREEELINQRLLDNLKEERNQKLKETDILVLRHLEDKKAIPKSLKEYRQALRDLPENIEDVRNPEWPTYP